VDNSQPGVFTCYDTTALCDAITAAKEQVDYLFVCVHWGVEHTTELTDYQVANGHAYIDAGADAVIGSHPHVLQGMEYYNGKPIFYSLGNFIFNETIGSTMAVKVKVTPSGEISYSILPAYASGAKTQMAEGEKYTSILSHMQSLSPTVSVGSEGELSDANYVP
jgi:poly-gamma-glutamate synthesis protein (capsule biosynthesis protein)